MSVVIPCYNASMYVGDTLKSIFSQTYRDFEVILVNDGSSDTVALQEVIAPWMDRIVYLEICNQGPSTARNTGILAGREGRTGGISRRRRPMGTKLLGSPSLKTQPKPVCGYRLLRRDAFWRLRQCVRT